MAFIDVDGRKVHYELVGDGDRTITWTHGIGSSLESWRELVPGFPGYRHLTYSVRGMGLTEGPLGPVALGDWARDLNGLLDAVGIERTIIAGHSMGGAIAQRFTIDFPERVEALLLLATSSRVGPAAHDAWMRQADEIEDTNPRLAAARRAVADYNMDEDLKRFSIPTLILVGDSDPTTPAGGSVIMSRLIPHSELEIYPGIGHRVLHEEPKAQERVRQWLAGLPAA